jgi:hypothetical protein
MTESQPIDFETAFAELSKLNYLIGGHTAYALPRLNPAEFQTTVDEGDVVVIRGLRTGLHYGSTRVRRTHPNGNYTYQYTPFFRVKQESRTVIDWVRE